MLVVDLHRAAAGVDAPAAAVAGARRQIHGVVAHVAARDGDVAAAGVDTAAAAVIVGAAYGVGERDGVVGDRAVGHAHRPTVDEDSTAAERAVRAECRLIAGDDVAVQGEGGDAARGDPAPAPVPGFATRDRETGDRYRRGGAAAVMSNTESLLLLPSTVRLAAPGPEIVSVMRDHQRAAGQRDRLTVQERSRS